MLRGLSRQDWSSTSPSYPKNLIPKKNNYPIPTLHRVHRVLHRVFRLGPYVG